MRKGEDPSVEPAEPYVLGDLTIGYAERQTILAGRLLNLTAAEYDLLFELSVHAGRVVTHNQLLKGYGVPPLRGPSHPVDSRFHPLSR